MKLTRQELLDKVKNKDVGFFQNLFFGDNKLENKWSIVYDQHYGDGNDWSVAFSFPEENLFFLMEGYYSSHDSSEFDKISLAVPYTFTETRYRVVKKEDMRDINIDTILKTEE
jgi:hypothetical protein